MSFSIHLSNGQTSDDKITTFLMFEGEAEEAMNFYISLFPNSEITRINRYGPEGPGEEGSVHFATFTLNGQTFMAIDSYGHPFTFTPSISLFVQFDTVEEVDDLFHTLSEGGEVLMPLNQYPFSERFGWVNDRFGVSWQLNFGQLNFE
jgi:predicted 3-demethylubiquinone-9 3-methyltransferase (glyoxalase superfamily)